MKNITINYTKKTIEITKSFEKKAREYGSDAYVALRNARNEFPKFELVVKAPKGSNGFKGMDYDFMEEYIKTLHHKPLTTKNKTKQNSKLDANKWVSFRIGDLFTVELSKGDIKLDEMEEGVIPLISAGEQNNDVVGYIDRNGDGRAEMFPANRITVDMFCNAYYQDEPFYAVSHGRVNILNPKFNLTKNIGLFIVSLIKQEQYKYSYGRAVYSGVAENMEIKLPIDSNGDPDWQFMENYIKALPYGDRL
jgi:hypothetical protein